MLYHNQFLFLFARLHAEEREKIKAAFNAKNTGMFIIVHVIVNVQVLFLYQILRVYYT